MVVYGTDGALTSLPDARYGFRTGGGTGTTYIQTLLVHAPQAIGAILRLRATEHPATAAITNLASGAILIRAA